MAARKQWPVALTIAGSDSGGGAGIQADLKTFAAFGVHGASAVTCLTAQNPGRVFGVEPCPSGMLRRQLEAVFAGLPPRAVKTGLLFSAENVRVVVRFLKDRKCPLVVDPVMVATSGAGLLEPAAKKALVEKLLPLATLVTPNLDETGVLLGWRPDSVAAMVRAARELHRRFGCAALIKGGHLSRRGAAADIFFDGRNELRLSAPFVKGLSTHGTGCTFSAAVCAALALGHDLPRAVALAKKFITGAIAGSHRIGKGYYALDWGGPRRLPVSKAKSSD